MATTTSRKRTRRLSPREALEVGRAARALLQHRRDRSPEESAVVEVSVDGRTSAMLTLPFWAVDLLADLLDDLSTGRSPTVAPYDVPVGTQAMASVLNVSRPWAAELDDRGDVVGVRVGTKRRASLGTVIDFRRDDERRRRAAADEDWAFLDEEASAVEGPPRRHRANSSRK